MRRLRGLPIVKKPNYAQGKSIVGEPIWEIKRDTENVWYGTGIDLPGFVTFLDMRSAFDFFIGRFPGTHRIHVQGDGHPAGEYAFIDLVEAARKPMLNTIMEGLNGTDRDNPKVNTLQDNDEGGMGESPESSRE